MLPAEKMQIEKEKNEKGRRKKEEGRRLLLLKGLGTKLQDLVGVSMYFLNSQKREHTISTQPPPPNWHLLGPRDSKPNDS